MQKTITDHCLSMNCVPNARTPVQILVLVQHWPPPFAIDCRNSGCTIRHTHADWCVSSSRSIVAADSTTNMDRMHRMPIVGPGGSSHCHRRRRRHLLSSYRRVHCHCHDLVYVRDHVCQQLPLVLLSTCRHTHSFRIRNNVHLDCDNVHLEGHGEGSFVSTANANGTNDRRNRSNLPG